MRQAGAYTTGWTVPTRAAVTTLSRQFRLVNLSAWDSASFTLWVWGVNGAKVSRDSTLIATWKIVRSPSAPPGGSLDSTQVQAVMIRPNPATLAVNTSLQYCGYVKVNAQWLLTNTGTSCATVPTWNRERMPSKQELQLARMKKELQPFANQLIAAGMAKIEPDPWAEYQ